MEQNYATVTLWIAGYLLYFTKIHITSWRRHCSPFSTPGSLNSRSTMFKLIIHMTQLNLWNMVRWQKSFDTCHSVHHCSLHCCVVIFRSKPTHIYTTYTRAHSFYGHFPFFFICSRRLETVQTFHSLMPSNSRTKNDLIQLHLYKCVEWTVNNTPWLAGIH